MSPARGRIKAVKKRGSTSEDVDWKGILSAASLFGNALQALDRAETKGKLDETERKLVQVFLEKEQFKNSLRQLQLAYRKMREDFMVLEKALAEKELELARLKTHEIVPIAQL